MSGASHKQSDRSMAGRTRAERATALLLAATAALVAACASSPIAQAEPRTTLSDGAVGKIEFWTYTPASQRPLITRT